MTLNARQVIFYTVWGSLLLTPIFTLSKTTTLNDILSDNFMFQNVMQRWMGMTAFMLVFSQIVLGSLMDKMVQIIGAKSYRLHIIEGISAWFLIIMHPILEGTITYKVTGRLTDALLVYLPLFRNSREILIAFGIITFLLINTAVFAGYFRTKPLLRVNWKKFHILNYFAFYFLLLHAQIGSDIAIFPFSMIYWAAAIIVTIIVIVKLKPFIFKTISS